MRHGKKINSLSSSSSKRKAMLKNLSRSFIVAEGNVIKTTLAKAKAFRRFFEKTYITRVKRMGDKVDTSKLLPLLMYDKKALNKLIELCNTDNIKNRPGGYLSIIKISGLRQGDAAQMAFIKIAEQ